MTYGIDWNLFEKRETVQYIQETGSRRTKQCFVLRISMFLWILLHIVMEKIIKKDNTLNRNLFCKIKR